MKNAFLFILVFSCNLAVTAQTTDTVSVKKTKIKKGWSFGAVPAVGYDRDIGYKIGAAVNFFNYGDGTIYPRYRHSIYLEYSITTKGSGINQILYDSRYLIPGIRISAEVSYLTEKALDFYGFNGYQALYDKKFEDDSPNNPDYRSRLYYREERKLFRLRSDFQGKLLSDKIRWIIGISNYNIKADTIDLDHLNSGKSDNEKLPATGGGLYGQYVSWGVIQRDQARGGNTTLLKVGLVFDTRDNEPNPMHGIWTDVMYLWVPKFIGNPAYHYSKIIITHRQYFTLISKRLSFVYRLSYQGRLSGNMPYYMLPFVYNEGNSLDRDGIGGAKTVRGILRDRVVGEDYIYGNLELRWKFIRTIFLKQNFYSAINTFYDFGKVTQKYSFNKSGVPAEYQSMFPDDQEKYHISYGAGIHFVFNENFVIAVNYGLAADKRDGSSGLYININWLF
jgi:hypothetical protein